MADFIYNIGYYNTHNTYASTVLKSIFKLAWVVTMGIARPLFLKPLGPRRMFLNNKVFELNLKQKVHCFFKLLTLLTVLGKVTNPVVFGHEGMPVKLSVLSSFQHVNCFQTQWIYLLPHQKSNSRLMAIGIKLPNYDY